MKKDRAIELSEPVTLEGVAATVGNLSSTVAVLSAKVDRLAVGIETLAVKLEDFGEKMMAGFSFFGERVGALEIRTDSLETKVDSLGTKMDALEFEVTANTSKIEGVHRRIDDVVETRARRDELAATNVRVGRIEGHLGLA